MTTVNNLAAGARNLLLNCAGLKAGDRVLIVQEDPALGWYDTDAPLALGKEAAGPKRKNLRSKRIGRRLITTA